MRFSSFFVSLLAASALLASCTSPAAETAQRLPILGERDVRPNPNGGPADTIYATAPVFHVTDQAGQPVTNQTFRNQAYITDFFFATCPGICPKMQGELLKVYKKYATDQRLAFLSYTIDPAHDSVAVLRDYAQRLGISDARRWHFATTVDKDTVFQLAKAYFTAAQPDKTAPGGFAHNGTFALVDDEGHIRGLYDSLNPKEVERLFADLPILFAEMDSRKAVAAK